MALKSTIYKANLQVADMDRHYYADHALNIACHPSETLQRMMTRVLVFALHAHERLEFGKGISDTDEPDIWRKDLTGEIQQWVEVGLPDERTIRQASSRAKQVAVYAYGGRAADQWWDNIRSTLSRCRNLTVLNIPQDGSRALAQLAQRSMDLHCSIQEGQILMGDDTTAVPIEPVPG